MILIENYKRIEINYNRGSIPGVLLVIGYQLALGALV